MRITDKTRAAFDDASWALAVRLKRFGYAEISAELKIPMERASLIVRGWEKEGRVLVTQKGVGLRKMFEVATSPVRPELAGSVTENLWTAMRGLKSFTPLDLAAHSTTATVKVSLSAAQGYCQALLRGGYLKVERTAVPGRRDPIYRLVKSTGPKPPREKRVKVLIDDNLGKCVHCAAGAGGCR